MAQQDVRRALEMLTSDAAVADRLAEGDFSDVSSLDLSADEKTLVQDAAADLPEVAGFASDYLLQLDGIKGESFAHKLDNKIFSQKFNLALKYGFKQG
jgi:hypothetical protein